MLNLRLYCCDTYNYLKTELVLGLHEEESEFVQVYINEYLPDDSLFEAVLRVIPKKFEAINGNFIGYYVSYYFNGEVFLVTDKTKKMTYAKISKKYESSVKSLFLVSLFRSHMNRHWIAHGYHVYHACGIYDSQRKEAFLVAGASGIGKTTFALEALKSGACHVISEDKVVINPKTDEMFGSSIVHVKEKDIDRYRTFTNQYEIINGGIINKKYSFVLLNKYYMRASNFHYTIFLNQSCEQGYSMFQRIEDEMKCKQIFKESQEGIYLSNEYKEADRAYEYITSKPIFELYHNKNMLNFEVYQKNKGKELYE